MSTRRTRIALLIALLAVSRNAAAQAVPDLAAVHGALAFDAHATLGAFTGTTTAVSGNLQGGPGLSAVRGFVEAPTKTLTTNNGHRDNDMAGSLEIEKYPTMRFDLDSLTVGDMSGDSTAVLLKGRFTLHGQVKYAAIPGWVWLASATARFRGALPINVKDYGVGGLSKMLGVLKMNEMITVRIDVTFGGT